MIRKSVYEEVEGLDELAFAVSYNDVDLCLKVGRAGYLTVWAHRAVVMHEGSVSQVTLDPLSQSVKRQRFVKEQCAFYERWMPMLVNDPAYNRNLSLCGNGFEVDDKPLIDPALRTQPVVLLLSESVQPAQLSAAWSGLRTIATVSIGQPNLQVADLLRMAPDVVVVPGKVCQWDPLVLMRFGQYFNGVKVLDLSAPAACGWGGDGQLPEHIRSALPLVDRVLVTESWVAQALAGLHADVRIVSALFGGADPAGKKVAQQASAAAEQLQACLP